MQQNCFLGAISEFPSPEKYITFVCCIDICMYVWCTCNTGCIYVGMYVFLFILYIAVNLNKSLLFTCKTAGRIWHIRVSSSGTSSASMNRTSKTNAAKGIRNHYNEYKKFHQWEVEAHICASFMEMSGMSTMEGKGYWNVLYLINVKWLCTGCIWEK